MNAIVEVTLAAASVLGSIGGGEVTGGIGTPTGSSGVGIDAG